MVEVAFSSDLPILVMMVATLSPEDLDNYSKFHSLNNWL